jgi:hypothetical protein
MSSAVNVGSLSAARVVALTPGARYAVNVMQSISLPPSSKTVSDLPPLAARSFAEISIAKARWNFVGVSRYVVVHQSLAFMRRFFLSHLVRNTHVDRARIVRTVVTEITLDQTTQRQLRLRVREFIFSINPHHSVIWILVRANRYPVKPRSDLIEPGFVTVRFSKCISVQPHCRQRTLRHIDTINIVREIVNEQFVLPSFSICPTNFVEPTYVQFFRRGHSVPLVTAVVERGGCGTISIVRGTHSSIDVLKYGPRFFRRIEAVAGQYSLSP